MAVKWHKGQLLIKIRNFPFSNLLSASSAPFTHDEYELDHLSPATKFLPGADVLKPADHWLLARPKGAPLSGGSPWDAAHEVAREKKYTHFVEPDLLYKRSIPGGLGAIPRMKGVPNGKLDDEPDNNWPPHDVDPKVGFDPGWHLRSTYTGFEVVRNFATGIGIRIAHLDTGYTPDHDSTPRNIRPNLGYDFWDNRKGAVDPHENDLGDQPGHGTATIALLAGNKMRLPFGTHIYEGDVGGAPDAEIVPVRISPSVIHIATSTMAQGLLYALAPSGDPNKPDPANRCDVVSISHGGIPASCWADVVNHLYEAGLLVVAASGDSIYLKIIDLATRYTVYPSAFNRVITAVGATYAKQPYVTDDLFVMQGCWGPDDVMEKAIAGFTPNVFGMKYNDLPCGFDMNFGGTSASTPQVAAACALWLQLYKSRLPADWRRVEACRLALFDGACDIHPNKAKLGWGLLDVPNALDETVATRAITAALAGKPSGADSVSCAFWRLLLGIGPPSSEEERMYETEVAQIVHGSDNAELRVFGVKAAKQVTASASERGHYLDLLRPEPMSDALKRKIENLKL